MRFYEKFSENLKKKAIALTAAAVTATALVVGFNVNSSIRATEKETSGLLKDDYTFAPKTSVTTASDGAILCDSLVQGIRDCTLGNGTYWFRVQLKNANGGITGTKDYLVELINYYDDVTYSGTVSLGDTSTQYKMLAVKYHKNLTINSGAYITAMTSGGLTYKKGMYICCLGTLTNNGTISMTARGTYNHAGEPVYLYRNTNGNYDYVPAAGGGGGARVTLSNGSTGNNNDLNANGYPGGNGASRSTGGGGSGGNSRRIQDRTGTSSSGAGSAGTSYSGGSGGGGICTNQGGTINAGDAAGNGGAGGTGAAARYNTSIAVRTAGGGAGNPGGVGVITNGTSGAANSAYYGPTGTGGLLVLYTNTLTNNGTISANGSNGGSAWVGGGASGGGSVNIFANTVSTIGTVTANGGVGVGRTCWWSRRIWICYRGSNR